MTPAPPPPDLLAAATPGPWRSLRDGNQYVGTRYLPTAALVGASRLTPLQQPWNPHAEQAFGVKPDEREVVRLRDEDADLIAALYEAAPALIEAARREAGLREALTELVECVTALENRAIRSGGEFHVWVEERMVTEARDAARTLLHDNAGAALPAEGTE